MNREQIIERFKFEHFELYKEYANMSHEQLLEQIVLEVNDLHEMADRVSLFMSECTDNMSNVTYTLESLRTLINESRQKDINEAIKDFCESLLYLEDAKEIAKEVKKYAQS